jgi:hypothetical protein
MARLTKQEIERRLLAGLPVDWKDANGKSVQLVLKDAKERRLFAVLLGSQVRSPSALPQSFIDALHVALDAPVDPASSSAARASTASKGGPWRLASIETEGFGGLNVWDGPPFRLELDQQSLLIEGPNGSGKSSLVAAILWALSGDRPRDHAKSSPHEPQPVFRSDNEPAGTWPPIACYPSVLSDLTKKPRVHVRLTFQDPNGATGTVERHLDGGVVTFASSPNFAVSSIFLETGLQMPARMTTIRLDEGQGRLSDAVQKLTGLDDLVALSGLVDGLCHRGREYLTYGRRDITTAQTEFANALGQARTSLSAVEVSVPDFKPSDTSNTTGPMATFGSMLGNKAVELAKVISDDLASNVSPANPIVYHQIIAAIGAAVEEIKSGLDVAPTWKLLRTLSLALDKPALTKLLDAIETAQTKAIEAVELRDRSLSDNRFQLKALGAQWHRRHAHGDTIEDCPLCEQSLGSNPSLADELRQLKASGEAAARTFDDNINAIRLELENSLPDALRNIDGKQLKGEPRAKMLAEFRSILIAKDRYSKLLVKFGSIVESALKEAPTPDLPQDPELQGDHDVLLDLNARLVSIRRSIALAKWYEDNHSLWTTWWNSLVGGKNKTLRAATEGLSPHLDRLSDALAKAEPYRAAAVAMRTAWSAGVRVVKLDKELKRRDAVAVCLAPLKNLGPLVASVAREAIEGLSDRIGGLLKRIHLTEKLQFHDAHLQRREKLVVRGGFVPEMRIDATLVANTSWLRAVLWAFIFALREEAVEQFGSDPFPILVLDDPQMTFDSEHRHRWAQYIASLQSQGAVQLLLTTYDETFLELLKVDGIAGREAILAAATPAMGHIGFFERDSLDRMWAKANSLKTPRAGQDYIGKVREFAEGLLRLMLRGEDANVTSVASGYVLGNSRDKLEHLHNKKIAPWDRTEIRNLVSALDKNNAAIKHMEIAHHAGRVHLGMAEAIDVEEHWRKKIWPALNRAFRLIREHRTLHGGLSVFHAPTPNVALPEGHKTIVKSISFSVLGRAAALSNGQVADGLIDLSEYAAIAHKKITLAQHAAFRLIAPTLEPVARTGDLLIVKEAGEPSEKSLVVALSEDRLLARRFQAAYNHSDIAVLSAQSINPRQIAPPMIAHRGTLILHKIVGVIYQDAEWTPFVSSSMEVCECDGGNILTNLAANALGLVEVVGSSAEPLALNGQYLIIKGETTAVSSIRLLDGRPVIAADTDNVTYFKRLRLVSGTEVVLESMDSGGDWPPVVLAMPGQGSNCLDRVWPVAGVLFELP